MNARERIMAIGLGAVLCVALVAKVVYPALIKPMLEVDDQIAKLEAELDDQLFELDRIDNARLDYKKYVERNNSTDPMAVGDDVRARLDEMLNRSGLGERRVTPRQPSTNRKTNLSTVRIDLTAEGQLEKVITFLQGCYELPQLVRFQDVKISPKRSRGQPQPESFKLDGTLEVCVLPKDDLAGNVFANLDEQPESLVRHSADTYAMIWNRKPFHEYEEPPPPPKPVVRRPTRTEEKDDPPPPPPPRNLDDPDRNSKTVVVAMLYGPSDSKNGELLVVKEGRRNRRDSEYVTVGQKMDGGELIAVHPFGGIVQKEKGDFFYPVGKKLSQSMPVAVADEFPEIKQLAERLREEARQNEEESAESTDDEDESADPAEAKDETSDTEDTESADSV